MPVSARTVCSTGAKVTPSPYGGHDPVIGSARSPRSFASSATRRDFPTPASATRTRTRREPDRSTSSKRSVRISSSVRRPTNGTRSRSGSARSPRTCHTISGSLLPFTVAVGRASTSNRPRTARSVSSPITTASRGASDCIREVVFTTSPATASPTWGPEPNETTASPVFTATRTAMSGSSRRRSSIVSRIRSAARTARTGSSSCATGAPNTPITASPMNLSSVPPNRSRSSFTRRWNGTRVRRTSSGSARSERSVNPTRSANTIVTVRRSSAATGAASTAVPQNAQKRAPAGSSAPQFAQAATGRV